METHIKNTIFLKDSVLFISIDGKEYEVSNPEAVATNKLYFIDVYPTLEWPGGVELIEREVPTGGSGSTSYPIFETVARLLPKEKKEPVFIPEDHPFAAASHSKVYDTGSDYKQFEDGFTIASHNRDEPSQEELASKAFDQLWDILESIRNEDYTVSDDNRKLIDELFTRLTP